jgi:hypothetical protein
MSATLPSRLGNTQNSFHNNSPSRNIRHQGIQRCQVVVESIPRHPRRNSERTAPHLRAEPHPEVGKYISMTNRPYRRIRSGYFLKLN